MLASPSDLTLPREGSTTARRILGQYLKLCARDLTQIPMGRFAAPVFDSFADARARLLGLLRGPKAGLAYACVRRPSVSVLIRCLHRELWGSGDVGKLDAMLAELSCLVWFELALAGELPEGGVQLRTAPLRLQLACLGVELERAEHVRLGLAPGLLVVEGSDSSGAGARRELALSDLAALGAGEETELRAELEPGASLSRPLSARRTHYELASGIYLVTADNNPLALVEAHPDKQGNAIELGGRSAEAWQTALREAYQTIETYYPELAHEMGLVMHAYHPVGYDAERHLSASYAEAVGSAYLSLHPDSMTLSEALIHEFCHNKLNALLASDALLHNAFEPLFSSPVRPDPRPLLGVLLAVHAFVPVAELYRRMLERAAPEAASASFAARHADVIKSNQEGIGTLRSHAEPTELGAVCLEELYRWSDASRGPAAP